jgi:hypothetical protein
MLEQQEQHKVLKQIQSQSQNIGSSSFNLIGNSPSGNNNIATEQQLLDHTLVQQSQAGNWFAT